MRRHSALSGAMVDEHVEFDCAMAIFASPTITLSPLRMHISGKTDHQAVCAHRSDDTDAARSFMQLRKILRCLEPPVLFARQFRVSEPRAIASFRGTYHADAQRPSSSDKNLIG